MGNPRNPRIPFVNLLAILQFSLVSTLAAARFAPPDNHLIACGSPSAAALDDRRVFLPDSSSALLRSPHPRISVSAAPNPSPFPSPLSRTARIFTRPSSYVFPIKNKGTHLLRLHFYPFPTPDFNLSSAHFHVSAAGFVLLTNFTAPAPSLKEYLVRADAGKLVVTFVPACPSTFAFINAIEVISAPDDLVADVARLVSPDHVENFNGLSKQAMETLYRINVGGPKVTPFNDTLWRTWTPDTGFFESSTASATVSFSGRIMYRKYGASREVAPNSVYSTARVIKGADGLMSDSNITWVFPVSSGYRYLVRMHFCDIASLALNELYFNVYINGYAAYEDLDLSDAAGQLLASPYYVDFVVDASSSGLLNVSVGPSKLSDPLKISGLLNGLEIMKINNTMGSLDGEFSVISILESPRRKTFGAFVRSLLCGFAFMSLSAIVFMLVMRLRTESRNHVAWSPLPMDASEGKLATGNSMLPSKLVYF